MIYQFNQITLDTTQYRLSLSGNPVAVEPQVFDLLVFLVEHKDRVVTRGELLENLWKGKVVSDSALGARLKDARKAVSDSGNKQEVIKTIHGRGYQFIAPVKESRLGSFSEKVYSATQQEISAESNKPSIAVLQFTNLSDDPKQHYFSDGMATNICSRLSRVRSLLVKSGYNFDSNKTPLSQISKELEVDYLLAGSVQREDDHVRVFVELKDGVSGEIKWSEHFDRRGTSVIDIQDEIAREITGTLWSYKGTIRDAAHDKLSRKPTQDFNAFDFILKGVYHKEKFTDKDQLQAHECFDQAIELDPNSAEALGWRAWAHIIDITMGWSEDSAVSLAQAYSDARRAIELDPYSEMGHWALGEAFIVDKKYQRGFEEYDKALEINPNNPDLIVTKGTELSIYGQFDDGIELIHQGIEFNKHHPEWYFWHLGIACFAANRLADAIKAFNQMNSQNKDTLIYLSASYALTGELDEAKKHVSELFSIDPNTNLDDIATSHDSLSEASCQQLIDGINLAMGNKKPCKKLHIV